MNEKTKAGKSEEDGVDPFKKVKGVATTEARIEAGGGVRWSLVLGDRYS